MADPASIAIISAVAATVGALVQAAYAARVERVKARAAAEQKVRDDAAAAAAAAAAAEATGRYAVRSAEVQSLPSLLEATFDRMAKIEADAERERTRCDARLAEMQRQVDAAEGRVEQAERRAEAAEQRCDALARELEEFRRSLVAGRR